MAAPQSIELSHNAERIVARAARLTDAEIAELCARFPELQIHQRQDGEPLFSTIDETDLHPLYVIVSGAARAYTLLPDNREATLEIASPGQTVGDIGAVLHTAHTARVQALGFTELLEIPADRLDELLVASVELRRVVLQQMAQRLVRATSQIHFAPLRNANVVADERLAASGHLVHQVAGFLGSGRFALGFALLMVVWLLLHPAAPHLDSAFALLGVALAIGQIYIGNLILNSQRRADALERAANDVQFESVQTLLEQVRGLHQRIDTELAEIKRAITHSSRH